MRIEFRNMESPEIDKLRDIDRSEVIDEVYHFKSGKLALEKEQGNIVRAAEALGVSRPTLYDLLKKHGVQGGD